MDERIKSKKSPAKRTVIILSLVVGLILLLLGSTLLINNKESIIGIIVLSFGISLTASGIISFTMLQSGFLDIVSNANDLALVFGNKLGLHCAKRFSLLNHSEINGLSNVYLNREEALKKENFTGSIISEDTEIFIIGSSLMGLIQNEKLKDVWEIIKNKANDKRIELIFMFTHPLFADFRALQELRPKGEIGNEIIFSLKELKNIENPKYNNISVYLYKGTPTLFGIRTTAKMLINPYPYGNKASDSPCFEFEVNKKCYTYYNQTHFRLNFGEKIEKIDLNKIADIEARIKEYSNFVDDFENHS
jgi:hypothetical protein